MKNVNMKKNKLFSISFFGACLIFALSSLFFSCNFGDDEESSPKPETKGYILLDKVTLPGSFKALSRDIVPSLDTDILSNLVLTGSVEKANGSWDENCINWQAENLNALNLMASKEEIVVRTGRWRFTLSAIYNEGDSSNSATSVTYSATIDATIVEGANTLTFNLIAQLEEGTSYYGGLSFSMKYKEGSHKNSVEEILVTIEPLTGSWSSGGGTAPDIITENITDSIENLTNDEFDGQFYYERSVTNEARRLLSGKYWFSVTFKGPDEVPLGVHKELLNVSPCLTSARVMTFDLNETYEIKYYVGAKEVSEYVDIEYDGSLPCVYSRASNFTLPDLIRNGFTFSHWALDINNLGANGPQIDVVNPTLLKQLGQGYLQNVVLYAVWENSPLANINGEPYYSINEIKEKITTAEETEELEIVLYSGVSFADIGKSDGSGISNAVLNTTAASVSIDMSEVTELGTNSEWEAMNFLDCTKLKSLVASSTRQNAIQRNLCKGCTGLESVTIFPCAHILYTGCFENCSMLKNVILVDSENSNLSNIYDRAFKNCVCLVELSFPTVKMTLNGAFSGCTSLKSVEFTSDFIEELGENVFSNSGIESFVVPNGVPTIGGYAFKNCKSLKTVTIPSSVSEIKRDAFVGCTALEEITFEDDGRIWKMVNADSSDDVLKYFRTTNSSKNVDIFVNLYTSQGSEPTGIAQKTQETEMLLMKTGPAFNQVLDALGAKSSTAIKNFKPSASFPEEGGEEPAEENVLYLDELEEEVKAWKSGPDENGNYTIYFFAKGYTDSNKKIPLSPDCSTMFKNTKFETIDCSLFDTKDVTNMSYMFGTDSNETSNIMKIKSLNLSTFDTSKVENMSGMFQKCYYMETLTLSDNFNAQSLTDASHMFDNCEALKALNLSNFKGTKGAKLDHMFYYCRQLSNLTLPSEEKCLKVIDGTGDEWNKGMCEMFGVCKALKTLTLKCFDTTEVSGFYDLFFGCSTLETVDISTFIIQKENTSLKMAFQSCVALKNLTLPSTIGTQEHPVTCVENMFDSCNALTDLSFMAQSEWYVMYNFDGMIKRCQNLETAIFPSSFHMIETTNNYSYKIYSKYMFEQCTKLKYVDLSKVNFKKPRCDNMFLGCTALETIVMPPNTQIDWQLGLSDSKITGQLGTGYTVPSDGSSDSESFQRNFYRTDSTDGQGYFTSPYSVFVASSNFTDAEGNDETGDGTRIKPFASVSKAIQSIKARIEGGEPSDGGASIASGSFTPGWSVIVLDEAVGQIKLGDDEGNGFINPGTDNVVIQGIGYGDSAGSGKLTVSGTGRVIETEDGFTTPLRLRNITVTGGNLTENNSKGGGLYIGENGRCYLENGCKVTGNSVKGYSSYGGGVYLASNAWLFLSGNACVGSKVKADGTAVVSAANDTEGNYSNYAQMGGGGIYGRGAVFLGYTDNTTVDESFTGGVFYNYSETDGGGIYMNSNAGVLKMPKGSVNYNGSHDHGAGIYLLGSAQCYFDGGEICGNQTYNQNVLGTGGGVCINDTNTSFYMTGGTISGNKAYAGGGIYTASTSGYISGGTISDNQAVTVTGTETGTGEGGAVYVKSSAKLKLSGNPSIPAGEDNKNDIFLEKNTSNPTSDYGTICLGEFTYETLPSSIARLSLPTALYQNLTKVLTDQDTSVTTLPNVSTYYSNFTLNQLGTGDFTITKLGVLSQAISGNVTVSLKNEVSDINVTKTPDTANSTYTFTAPSGLGSYSWYLNDEPQTSASGIYTITFDYSTWAQGVYDVRLEASNNGKYYSYFGQMMIKTSVGIMNVTEQNYDGMDVLSVSSAEEMVHLSELTSAFGGAKDFSGKTVILSSDITLSSNYVPISTFCGTFDGNGKTISGLNGQTSLITKLINGTVKDLTVSGSATIAGITEEMSDNSVISNCTNNANISGTGTETDQKVGGIAGRMSSSADSPAKIENCVNNGTITTSGLYAGGITGGQSTGKQLIDSCVNTGTVTSSSTSPSAAVGGITGIAYGFVINCINCAEVKCAEGSTAGGITGELKLTNTMPDSIRVVNCTNTGYVRGRNYAGGIAGLAKGISDFYNCIYNCYNQGEISAPTANAGALAFTDYNSSRDESHYKYMHNYYKSGTASIGFYGFEDSTNTSYVSGTTASTPTASEMSSWVSSNQNAVTVYKSWKTKTINSTSVLVPDVGYDW